MATNQITVCVTVHYASLDDLVPGLFGASVLTHFPETDRQTGTPLRMADTSLLCVHVCVGHCMYVLLTGCVLLI